MKLCKTLIYLTLALSAASCHSHSDHSHEHDGAETEEHEHAPGVIMLHDKVADRFGLRIDTASTGVFHRFLKSSGTVVKAGMDDAVASAPTAGIVHFSRLAVPGSAIAKGAVLASIDAVGMTGGDANEAARAELEAARANLERVQDLFAERLATQGELLEARAAAARAQAMYSPDAASGKVKAPIAATLTALLVKEGQYVDAGTAIASLGKGSGSVLRVDIPARYYREAAAFGDLRADFPTGESLLVSQCGGQRTQGPAATDGTATSSAYIPVYFTSGASSAPAGTPFTAYLIGNKLENVLTVPTEALSEQQGQFFIYVQTMPEHYEKVPVRTGASDGIRTEILSGLAPGTSYVSSGVQAVRLAETSAVAPQGHTHNH
ncbi:MAG: biotin/lipoyl-binding protein [Muribaculaceae bacterium]|nr:biotin/lipoyl-binding protein [Muribaculaceae bacterium]